MLALRAHYTMDVYSGAVTALLVAVASAHLAPAVDRGLARLSSRIPPGAAPVTQRK